MGIIEFVLAMILIWFAVDMVCIVISIMQTKHDLDLKTWERIEKWR